MTSDTGDVNVEVDNRDFDIRSFVKALSKLELDPLHSERDNNGHLIEVREYQKFRWMQIGSRDLQALVHVDDPARPLLNTNLSMLAALLFCPSPQSMLNLGLGGGSFERFFTHVFPKLSMTSVELNTAVVGLARKFFFLPPHYPVVIECAENYLARCSNQHDLIFCDVFDSRDHPVFLLNADFYGHCHRCLSTKGVLALNLAPKTRDELLEILVAVRKHFSWVLLLDVDHCGNYLLYGLKQEAGVRELLEARAEHLQQSWGLELMDLPGRLTRLPKPKKALQFAQALAPVNSIRQTKN